MEKYFDVLLDSQMPKPILSLHLLNSDKSQSPKDGVANLLPLPASILQADKLSTQLTRLLDQEGNEATIVRSRYARILEQVFTFADGIKHDEQCMFR